MHREHRMGLSSSGGGRRCRRWFCAAGISTVSGRTPRDIPVQGCTSTVPYSVVGAYIRSFLQLEERVVSRASSVVTPAPDAPLYARGEPCLSPFNSVA